MFKLAFIGTGGMARIHASCLMQNKKTEIVKCYDLNFSSACEFAAMFGGEACSDEQGIFLCDGVDAVYICTMHDSHEKYITDALRNNKNVFVEKPLALSFKSAERIIGVYEGAGRILKAGFNMRVTPSVTRFKQLLQENSVNADAFEAKITPPPFMSKWQGDRHLGGGVLACLGSHIFDFISYIMGTRIKEVNCSLRRVRQPEALMENSAVLMLRMENGVEGSVILNDMGIWGYHVSPSSKLQSMVVYSEQGTYSVEAYGDINYSRGSDFIIERIGPSSQYESWGYQNENNLFIDELSGKKTELCNVYNAAEAALVVDASKDSAMTGRWAAVDYSRVKGW